MTSRDRRVTRQATPETFKELLLAAEARENVLRSNLDAALKTVNQLREDLSKTNLQLREYKLLTTDRAKEKAAARLGELAVKGFEGIGEVFGDDDSKGRGETYTHRGFIQKCEKAGVGRSLIVFLTSLAGGCNTFVGKEQDKAIALILATVGSNVSKTPFVWAFGHMLSRRIKAKTMR